MCLSSSYKATPTSWSRSHPRHVCPWRYQMFRFTPAQIDFFSPCVACTSPQCSRVLGTSSSGSGSGRTPLLGLATTMGRGPRWGWNSTTWSCFLSASIWWVSWRTKEGGKEVWFKKKKKTSRQNDLHFLIVDHKKKLNVKINDFKKCALKVQFLREDGGDQRSATSWFPRASLKMDANEKSSGTFFCLNVFFWRRILNVFQRFYP